MSDATQTKLLAKKLAALKLVLEEIFALLELQLDGTVKRLPRLLHVAALQLLYPAEAALRRLILVASYGLKVSLTRARPFPLGHVIARNETSQMRFQLFDPRKNFAVRNGASHKKPLMPRLHVFGASPLIPLFQAQPVKAKGGAYLCRRYFALKAALENIPHEARRMALWQMRRAQKVTSKFRFPLRPGPAPGFKKKQGREVDRLLKACHDFAFDYAPLNTS